MPPHGPSQVRSWRRSPRGQILLACLAIAAFFLIMEHRAPGLDVLPYILFLTVPCAAPVQTWLARQRACRSTQS